MRALPIFWDLKETQTNKTNFKKENSLVNNAGCARECELCKLAGAPEFAYKSHYTNQCKKKGDYQKKISGGVGERAKALCEYELAEKELRKELKLLKKVRKLCKENKKNLGNRGTAYDSSSLSKDEMSE